MGRKQDYTSSTQSNDRRGLCGSLGFSKIEMHRYSKKLKTDLLMILQQIDERFRKIEDLKPSNQKQKVLKDLLQMYFKDKFQTFDERVVKAMV